VVAVARSRLPEPELVSLDQLKPHPRNYREHPDDQLDHIEASLRQNGQYRNIVCAKDWTILAGHGVHKTMVERLKWKEARVIRLPISPNGAAALRVLAGDNETGRRAIVDDRALSMILKEVGQADVDGLKGTGYDERMLANLLYVTRNGDEIASFDAAAAWAGMPDHDPGPTKWACVVAFESEEARAAFLEEAGVGLMRAREGARVWSGVYPARPHDDLRSVKAVGGG
jgi:hypothetical protein